MQQPHIVITELAAMHVNARYEQRLGSDRMGCLRQGGNDWKSIARFNRAVLGVESMAESAVRIAEVGMAQPLDHDLVMLAHNGPLGALTTAGILKSALILPVSLCPRSLLCNCCQLCQIGVVPKARLRCAGKLFDDI